jgi:hypothetical protein
VVKLDSFIESEFDKEPCYQVIKFIGCPPRFYFEEVPIIIGLTPLEDLPDYLDIVAHWDMNFERAGVVSNFAHELPKSQLAEALNKHNVMESVCPQ